MAASSSRALSTEIIQNLKKAFYNDPKNILAQNACTRVDPLEVCTSRKVLERLNHVYQHKVEPDGKPMTNQKSSGRCWIFAALNVMRIPLMKKLNLEEFEFSQTYIYFWDKLERVNYWLNTIVETARRGEPRDSRLVSFLLHDPSPDGGQWDMFCNLVRKYGLMPKKCFPETYCSETTVRINSLLRSIMRGYARDLRALVSEGKSDAEIASRISEQVSTAFRIISIGLGIPPDEFVWEYVDKNKTYNRIGPITPLEFYTKHVQPVFNIDDKVCLVTDPRSTSPFGRAFTVDCLGNMVGGRPIIYNNQPVDLLIRLAADSIKNNEAVWFGCEVAKRFCGKPGLECLDVHDYEVVFGVNPSLSMSKADRLEFGDSSMSHAMVFSAVTVEDGVPVRFRVENSWGEDRGDKGFLQMTSAWFKEFGFEIVVDKKLVSKEVLDVFQQTPIVLPVWDPMGNLAH